MAIQLRDKSTCKYDQISLGEVMLRLDPGEGRIRTRAAFHRVGRRRRIQHFAWSAQMFRLQNRRLHRARGQRGRPISSKIFIMQGGVDTDFIKWREDDGIGRSVRKRFEFSPSAASAFAVRSACRIAANSAAAQLKPGDFDWDHIFGKIGTRWLHTGGIFAALSETTAALTIEAVKAAKKHGVVVSYDLNYRPSLWKSIGGLKQAQKVNREIAKYVDVMIGNEEDFTRVTRF